MVLAPHLLIGAAIGAKIKNFGWVIVLAFLSHVILDKIPHWEYGKQAIKKFLKNKSYKILFIFLLKMIADGLIGLIIVLGIIWYKNIIKVEQLILILVGALTAILPDIILGIFNLSQALIKKPSKKIIDSYKKIIHHSKPYTEKPTLFTLGTQILISLMAILILLA